MMLLTPDRRVDGELACMILITFLLYSIVLYVRADERIKLGRRHQHLRTSGRSTPDQDCALRLAERPSSLELDLYKAVVDRVLSSSTSQIPSHSKTSLLRIWCPFLPSGTATPI